MGAVFRNNWIVGACGEDFVIKVNPCIEFLELFALYAALVTWGKHPDLCHTRIVIFCDNKSVRDMVNSLVSHCKPCMKILRLIALDGIKYNHRVYVKYVKSKENILADALSRFEFKKFWRNAPKTMNRFPDEIPEHIWPVDKIWNLE